MTALTAAMAALGCVLVGDPNAPPSIEAISPDPLPLGMTAEVSGAGFVDGQTTISIDGVPQSVIFVEASKTIFVVSLVTALGDADNRASVSLTTCAREGEGADALCGVWTDPEFDPQVKAFYYARVVENPSCRWSWRLCLALPEGERPPSCEMDLVPKTIQEMAWASPIWLF